MAYLRILVGVYLITMTCTAIIRCFCLVEPFLYQKYVKPKTVACRISLLWLIYCILQAFLLSYGHGEYSKRRTCCRYDTDKFDGKEIVAIKLNYINLALIFAHCSLIFLAYFKVFRFVSHHNHAVADSLQQPANHSHIEEAKITKTVAVVVLGFLSCYVPATTMQFISVVGGYERDELGMPVYAFLIQSLCVFLELLRFMLPLGAEVAPDGAP